MRILPTQNDGYGFHGEVWRFVNDYTVLTKKHPGFADTDADEKVSAIWDAVSQVVAKHIAKKDSETVRAFLDSKIGRHFHDAMTEHLPKFDPDGKRKITVTAKQFADAAEKTIRAEKWVKKELARFTSAESIGYKINKADQMDDLTKAVFETTEDGELPFHGELIVEGDEGQLVTLDEADVMEDVVIEAFEQAISDAVLSDPNLHVSALREIDEALADGDYETAMESGCALLARCGVDAERIEEFKKGFKTSATQRSRMTRARAKAKTGGQLMALRARRRAARKGSSRTKRARYYKSNKRRISRRRAQLQNSINLDANTVMEMAEQGMTFVVVHDGEEPVFADSRETAESIAGDTGVVIELTDEQIDEACKKAGGKRKGKKPAEDMPMEAESEDEEEEEEEDGEEDSEDEEDYADAEDEEDDEEDDEEETDESVEEAALDETSAASLANEIAKFMKQNPRVGYGELATRFKIGRDVAQQATVIAGRVAGAKGDEGSWLYLAKEIMGKLMKHSAGSETPAAPTSTSLPRKNHRVAQVASVQDDGADLQEDDDQVDEAGTQGTKPKVVISAGNKAGTTKVTAQALPKAKLKGKEGAIKSGHATGESEDVTDQDDELDEVQDKNGGSQTHQMGKGKGPAPKAGPTKLNKPGKLTREDDHGEDGEPDLVEVSTSLDKAEALVAAAAANGLDSATKVKVETKEGRVSILVPAVSAAAIRKAIA